MNVITEQASLAAFCEQLSGGDFIALDTEFIRDKTYFPKLCLLQIAGSDHAAIIDPLAPRMDLSPVFALLENPKLTKVFHAARQDIEIFYLLTSKIPAPLFDTQIAAAVCGFGDSASYETLVNKIVGAEVDKSSRFTDWSARPLSQKQLDYALSDVTHLCVIYETLQRKLDGQGRISWIAEEHARMADPAIYKPDPNDAWQRLKVGTMRPKQLAVLRELARWRETEARTRDVPRGRIIKDEALIELAYAMPRGDNDFDRMRSLDRNVRNHSAAVIACVERALALPSSDYPQGKNGKRPPQNVASALAMLQLLLKVQAEQQAIAGSMIASKDDLEKIAAGENDTPALQGWRYDIFGAKAMALMQGKLKLSLDPNTGLVALEESA